MNESLSVSDLKNKYIEVFKTKVDNFNTDEYEDYKQRFYTVLEESKSTKPNVVNMTISNKEKESNTFKFFLKELQSNGIGFIIVNSSLQDHSQVVFNFNVNKL